MPYDDDDEYNDPDDQETESQPNPLRQQIKRLEKQVRDLTTKAQEGQAASRELLFAKAGIPLDNPKARYFVKGYDGELTTEAIKAAAAEIGLVEAPKQEQEEIPAEERQAHERIAAANTGTLSAGVRDFHAEMNAASNPQELLAAYLAAGGLAAEGAYFKES